MVRCSSYGAIVVMPRRRFQRPLGERRYKTLFLIAAEGLKTEPTYFSMFCSEASVVRVHCLKGAHASSPPQVLKRMKDHLRQQGLKSADQAWLVVDKDQWTDQQLMQLYQWSISHQNYGLAVSNPKFEYWLLLHFEDGAGVNSARDCTERLRRWLLQNGKAVDTRKITRDQIEDAIGRAKQRDRPPCVDWPRSEGQTTVYRLVQSILDASND